MKEPNKEEGKSIDKRFISMLSDYGFKVTFANETDTTFLKRAIQALIKSEIPIETIEFKRNELTAVTINSRGGLYDVTCIDEQGRRFIIEMQVTDLKNFIHRAKFYGFYHFNVIVKRGKYRFDNLNKIYVISILAGIAYPEIEAYHQHVCLRNEEGELIDDQITHILVELGKWNKSVEEIEKDNLDIDKLLYLMKTTEELTLNENNATDFKFPSFFAEDWIQQAIHELDLSQMSPEKRAMVEMQLVQDAQLAYHYEEDKLQYAKEYAKKIEQEKVKAEQELAKAEQEKVKAEQELVKEKRNGHKLLVRSFLKINYSKEQIADLQSWEIKYVEELIAELNSEKD
jgi:predicted transposase/invertase (TIGR01784 family)